MRQLFIIFILTFTGNIVFAQTEKESSDRIRTHFKWINEQQNFIIAELNNEDYLEWNSY